MPLKRPLRKPTKQTDNSPPLVDSQAVYFLVAAHCFPRATWLAARRADFTPSKLVVLCARFGENFEHGVISVLLRYEPPTPFNIRFRAEQILDLRQTVRKMQPGRFVVAIILKSRCGSFQQLRIDSRGRITSEREHPDGRRAAVANIKGPA